MKINLKRLFIYSMLLLSSRIIAMDFSFMNKTNQKEEKKEEQKPKLLDFSSLGKFSFEQDKTKEEKKGLNFDFNPFLTKPKNVKQETSQSKSEKSSLDQNEKEQSYEHLYEHLSDDELTEELMNISMSSGERGIKAQRNTLSEREIKQLNDEIERDNKKMEAIEMIIKSRENSFEKNSGQIKQKSKEKINALNKPSNLKEFKQYTTDLNKIDHETKKKYMELWDKLDKQ